MDGPTREPLVAHVGRSSSNHEVCSSNTSGPVEAERCFAMTSLQGYLVADVGQSLQEQAAQVPRRVRSRPSSASRRMTSRVASWPTWAITVAIAVRAASRSMPRRASATLALVASATLANRFGASVLLPSQTPRRVNVRSGAAPFTDRSPSWSSL